MDGWRSGWGADGMHSGWRSVGKKRRKKKRVGGRLIYCDGEGVRSMGLDDVHGYVEQEIHTLYHHASHTNIHKYIHIRLHPKNGMPPPSPSPPPPQATLPSSRFFLSALLSLLLILLKSGGASIPNSFLKSSTSLPNSSSQ